MIMGRIAFVAGSNGSQEFGQLKYAVSDANGVASALSNSRCQFQIVRPDHGVNPYAFREALDRAAASCKANDTFLVYFAGHGVLDAGELFLILDQTTSNFQTTALPAEDVLASIRRSKAQNKLLILDCCHAGGAIRYRSAGTLPVEELRIASANHLVLMASGRLEKVREYDRLGGGFLSQKICAALEDQFHEADTNRDLCLTIDELMDFLEKSASWYNGNSVHTDEKVSIPYLFGEKKGDFFLTPDKSPWHPYEIPWTEGSTMVVLPIPPIDLNDLNLLGRYWSREQNQSQTGYAIAIGKHLITNSQYHQFLSEGGAKTLWPFELSGERGKRKLERQPIELLPKEPRGGNFDHETSRWVGPFFPWKDERFNDLRKPVVCVSFNEALSYSRWAHELASSEFPGTFTYIVPDRLWDFVTFGVNDEYYSPRYFGRNHDLNIKALTRNFTTVHHKSLEPAVIDTENQRINKIGVTDLLGNVWEWCGSMNGLLCRFGFGTCLSGYPERVSLRGGGFLDDLEMVELNLSESQIPNGIESRHSDHGFRIASIIPIQSLPSEIQLRLQLLPPVDMIEESIGAVISEASEW